MIQKLQRVITGVLLTVFLAIGFSAPVYASSIQPQSYLYRVNVSSMSESIDFYQNKLGMTRDTSRDFFCPVESDSDVLCWTQFQYPELQGKIGLNLQPLQGVGNAALTIVVPDIDIAVNELRSKGVNVSNPICVGAGVYLATFSDPDGNRLALRQELIL
jgi:predicted enzyme related to lactoylglutathione lyase